MLFFRNRPFGNCTCSGTEAIKLGLQSYDYLERGVKTSVNAAKDIKERGTRTIKNTVKRVDKIGSFAKKRKLKKQMKRGVNGGTRKLTKKVTKNAAKATVKTAKKAAEAAKTAAKAAQKAAQATAKAVVGAVSRLVSFIASTMPYSLIIIGAILIILILCLAMSEIIGGAGGSVAGGGAWLVDDEQEQTPEEIYEGYKEFIEQAKDVMQTQAKDALKNTVTGFCSSDTTEPRKIIQYIDKNNNRTFYMLEFEKRNPNLKVFNAVMHLDEATPHLHIDFVPIAHSENRGLSTRVSMKGALREQGFSSSNRIENEYTAWSESERAYMEQMFYAFLIN